MAIKKVFCSHRGVDKPAVEAFARRLLEAGIDAWLDKWEIAPGDNIVARMEEGLRSCDLALIFFSNAFDPDRPDEGKWFHAEVQSLIYKRIDEGCRVIPVMVDSEVKLPEFLKPLARSGIDDFEAIVDAIEGRTAATSLGRSIQGEETFDVFLSHAHIDAEAVEAIALRLEDEQGLRVWLDRWILIPGEHWQQEMSKGLDLAKTCAVCIGANTPSGWFREEIEKALNRQTKEKNFRVIPVILPDGDRSVVDAFLQLRTWVEFKSAVEDVDALHLLACGIRGLPPGKRRALTSESRNEFALLKAKLSSIRDLRGAGLIDEVVAQEFQRRLVLDELIKPER